MQISKKEEHKTNLMKRKGKESKESLNASELMLKSNSMSLQRPKEMMNYDKLKLYNAVENRRVSLITRQFQPVRSKRLKEVESTSEEVKSSTVTHK